jgi:hypothetical protein
LGDPLQRRDIDLGIDLRGLDTSVPKQVRDLLQRCALPQHRTGDRMAQKMSRSSGRPHYPRATYCPVDKHGDSAVRSQGSEGRTSAQEEFIFASRRPRLLQVLHDRMADLLTQGQPCLTAMALP